MKLANLLPAPLFFASVLALPATASAQSNPAPGSRVHPVFATQPQLTRTPPRPAGLGGNLPPGQGGPNPSLTRNRGGEGSAAQREAAGLIAVCAPGGALSAQNAAENPGRARALVCPN